MSKPEQREDKPKWTEEQRQVISLRDRNILVSAAAGSGKTAVLVQRIIAEITEGEKPKDIDKLLVVTFTKAAAAEMRARIGKALEEKLLEEPENQHIQKQASLLHTAQITTIDSFCQSIIRNYFHVIHLDPAFRVGDETDMELMKQEVLEKLLEERYQQARENGDEEFLRFTDVLSTGRTDSAIEEMILSLYGIAVSYPWPEEWLEECLNLYQMESLEEMEKSSWMQELLSYLDACGKDLLQMAKKAQEVCGEPDGPEAYVEAVASDIRFLENLQGATKYQQYQELFASFAPMRLKAVRGKEVDAEKKEAVKNLRESYLKNGIEKLKKSFFFQSAEEMLADIRAMAPAVRQLVKVTVDFYRAFSEQKREEGILDFADMERFALEILLDKDEAGVRPSETAKELQEYYEEILTDEYQDSNYIQELLLTSLCRAPEQKPYLFMVGDVKQSIYKFRLARPELFLQKYQSYTVGKGPFQRIDLHQNFRSRESVLESANAIFEQIMAEGLGGIAYDDAAKLAAGTKFEECGNRTAGKTEVILIEQKSEDAFLQKKSLEAAVIGGKIRELVQGGHPLHIHAKEGYRPVEYGNIAILLRSLSGWSEEFIEVLNDMGIPAYADTKTGYFTSLEVETVLNLLHIIDNPRQDIPLAAVLRSCLGEITDEELAWLGSMPVGVNFWDRIEYFLDRMRQEDRGESWQMEEAAATALYGKLSFFIKRLKEYQKMAKTHSVYELLRRIYEETGYYYLMAAMPSGEKRRANLDILLQQSIEFAENGHQGIYGFTRYIESLQKSNVDFGEASVNGENTNAVRIMTIHKSKGLEFPVVFVAGMGKQFNLMDARKSTVLDGDYGVGCDFVDLELRVKQPTLLKRFMVNQMVQGTLAEEIRILYVALTRAKEQLFITGTASGLDKKLAGWRSKAGFLSVFQLGSAQTYLDWIVPAVLKRDSLFEVQFIYPEEVLLDEKAVLENAVQQYRMLMNWDTEAVYDEEMRQEIERQMAYRYPYASEEMLPVKVSVSELKRRSEQHTAMLEEEQEIHLEEPEMEHEREVPRPVFLQEEKAVSGAAKGTLYHLAMEHFPYRQIEGGVAEAVWKEYLGRLVEKGYMSSEESSQLDVKRFMDFASSGLGERMLRAELEGRLRREQPFMLGLKASELYPESDSEEMIMVQGIIDAFFFEGENIVLVDYKTDFVKWGQEKELAKKYQTQLNYYAKALERLTGKAVSEKIIYSFGLGKEIRLD